MSDKLWLVFSSVFAQAMRIGTTLVMARWVSKTDYGLYYVIVSLPGLISLGDLAIPSSLIQMPEDTDSMRDTAVILGLSLYAIYSVVLIGGSTYLSHTHHARIHLQPSTGGTQQAV